SVHSSLIYETLYLLYLVCVCVGVCVCMHVCLCVYVCVFVQCVCVRVCVCMHVCLCVYLCVFVQCVCVCVCVCVYACVFVGLFVYVCTVPSTIIGTPSEYEQNRLLKNMSLLFILLVFHSKYSQKSYLFIEVKLLKERKTIDIKSIFFPKTCVPQLLA